MKTIPAQLPATFPHKVEQLAPWRGVVYESQSHQKKYFKLVYRMDGTRKTLGFKSIDETMQGIRDLVRQLGQKKADEIVLSNGDGARYQQAMEHLAELPTAPAINIAIAEYVALKKVIGDVPPVEVGRFYVQRRGLNLPARTVKEVVDEMLKVKRAEKLSARHIKDLENRLARFGKDFQCQMADVDAPKLTAWLRGLGLSARSHNNFRTAVQTLMTFAQSCGYLTSDWDELERVPRAKQRTGEIEIFTPDEINKLLTQAKTPKHEKLLAFVAIGAFAGLRSAELERLTWPKVNLETGYITIDATVAKTNSRRVVPIQSNLQAWLTPLVQKQGKVCIYGNITNELLKLAKAAGVIWKQNALRHSYASYRLAVTQDAAKVSIEMGNSPKMIQQHYRALVTPEQGQTWFAINPDAVANVVNLPARAAR